MTLTVGSLFSGIGGFDLAAEWMGWTTVWHSEIDNYASQIMAKRFPASRNVGDITQWQPTESDRVSLVCGGFPCQPVSQAGKQLVGSDERWLWPEFARVVRILRPRYVVVENVPGLLARGMGDVLRDLSEYGYDAEWKTISAAQVGAPHTRERVWIVAYSNLQLAGAWPWSQLQPQQFTDVWRINSGNPRDRQSGWVEMARKFCRVDDGIPNAVDRTGCLGNSLVPLCAYAWAFQRIAEMETTKGPPSVAAPPSFLR